MSKINFVKQTEMWQVSGIPRVIDHNRFLAEMKRFGCKIGDINFYEEGDKKVVRFSLTMPAGSYEKVSTWITENVELLVLEKVAA